MDENVIEAVKKRTKTVIVNRLDQQGVGEVLKEIPNPVDRSCHSLVGRYLPVTRQDVTAPLVMSWPNYTLFRLQIIDLRGHKKKKQIKLIF